MVRSFFAVAVCAVALLQVAELVDSAPVVGSNCTNCGGADGQECCGTDHCCLYDSDPTTYMCCSSVESCCGTPGVDKEGECCVAQTTFCCPSLSSTTPNRCCPRWTVCCDVVVGNNDGCCVPLPAGAPSSTAAWRPWMGYAAESFAFEMFKSLHSLNPSYNPDTRVGPAMEAALKMAASSSRFTPTFVRGVHGRRERKPPQSAARKPQVMSSPQATRLQASTEHVWTLFMIDDRVFSLAVNLTDGVVLTHQEVAFDNSGEMTRVFGWLPKSERFYQIQTNFTETPGPNGRTTSLILVDPVTGAVEKTVLPDVHNFPTAYRYHCEDDSIYFATQTVDSSGKVTGYDFFSLDVSTKTVSARGSNSLASDPSDPYSGWFHAVSSTGSTVYRLGYQDVVHQENRGLGVTTLGASANSTWTTQIPTSSADSWYQSCHTASGMKDAFYSRALRLDGGVDLVHWQVGGDATVIAQLRSNDTEPRYFGPDAETLSCDQSLMVFATYEDGVLPILDGWSLSVVELNGATPAKGIHEVQIKGLIGEVSSISGIGLPEATRFRWHA